MGYANRRTIAEFCVGCKTDEEKAKAIYGWIIHNFEYDYDYHTFIQYFNVRKTLRTHKGVCYDLPNLFAAVCRCQELPCYVIDGISYETAAQQFWNRICYDNSWWKVDVTNDTSATKDNGNIYGFLELKDSYSPDTEYKITKIY